MRWVHIKVVEGFLGPKTLSSKLRAFVTFTQATKRYNATGLNSDQFERATTINGPESDVSQRNAHGYHLWNDIYKFEVCELNEAAEAIDMTVNADNLLRSDEVLATGGISQAFMATLLTESPGFVKEYDLALTPSKEFIYSNDDGGAQEVYNYRLRIRVLVTPAGYAPSDEHQQQLEAPSQHCDPKEEEEGDEDNGIGLVGGLQAVQAEMNRAPVFRALKYILFAGIALFTGIATIISLYQEFTDQTDSEWHTNNPQDEKRCIPFFDSAKELLDGGNATILLYNYNLQNASVAFCTNQTRDAFDKKMNADRFWDAAADVLGPTCALNGTNRNLLKANCAPYPACASYYDDAPAPFGVMWNYKIKASNTSAASCASVVTQISSSQSWPDCDQQNVYVYRKTGSVAVYVLFIFSFVFCWLRLLLELIGVIIYHRSNEGNRSTAILFRIAFRGLFGPLYAIVLMIRLRSTQLPIVTDPPILVDILFLLCEAVPSIALPVYAIYGCTTSINKVMLLLLIFGVVKVCLLVLSKIAMLILRLTTDKDKVAASEILEIKDGQ